MPRGGGINSREEAACGRGDDKGVSDDLLRTPSPILGNTFLGATGVVVAFCSAGDAGVAKSPGGGSMEIPDVAGAGELPIEAGSDAPSRLAKRAARAAFCESKSTATVAVRLLVEAPAVALAAIMPPTEINGGAALVGLLAKLASLGAGCHAGRLLFAGLAPLTPPTDVRGPLASAPFAAPSLDDAVAASTAEETPPPAVFGLGVAGGAAADTDMIATSSLSSAAEATLMDDVGLAAEFLGANCWMSLAFNCSARSSTLICACC